MGKRILHLIIITSILSWNSFSQKPSFFQNSNEFNKPRVLGTTVFLGGSWIGSMTALSTVWYSQQTKSGFHFFDDSRDWLQMDKIGHTFSAHYLTQKSYQLHRWGGLDKKRSLIFGGIFGFGFQSTFEVLDGYSSNYGFSWSDIGSNALGTGIFIGQEHFFGDQIVIPKFSYSSSKWASVRPEVLGSTSGERILKDYNGQTYWYTFGLYRFMKKDTQFPKWIALSVGHSVNEKLVGSEEFYTENNIIYNSYRQFLLSLDIDLTKIQVKKPWLAVILKNLNSIKVPFPTLEFSKHGIKGYGVYF